MIEDKKSYKNDWGYKMKQKLFKTYNINSAIMFFAFVCLYSLYFEIDTNMKTILTILVFTILFWIANSTQASRDSNKNK